MLHLLLGALLALVWDVDVAVAVVAQAVVLVVVAFAVALSLGKVVAVFCGLFVACGVAVLGGLLCVVLVSCWCWCWCS